MIIGARGEIRQARGVANTGKTAGRESGTAGRARLKIRVKLREGSKKRQLERTAGAMT